MPKLKHQLKLIVGFLIVTSLTFKIKNTKKIHCQSKNNQTLIANIDQQLADFDLAVLKSKQSLVINADLIQLQTYVKQKRLTYTEIMAIYLMRIKELDQNEGGLNAFISINPNAILQARKCDQQQLNTSILYGLAVAIKDNINTSDLPTTGGTVALANFVPFEDATIVTNLKAAGAIVIGKTNLSELANFMSEKNPNGFSNIKGQTLNPYGPKTISTLGSSAGSAVAMAASFASLAIGTETSGSIVAPSAILKVVGFKPSQDLALNKGVIPLAQSLDTVGPICKNIKDTMLAYCAMAKTKLDLEKLDKNYLKNKTVIIFKEDQANSRLLNLLKALEVNYQIVERKVFDNQVYQIILKEFATNLQTYCKTYQAPITSLKSLVAFNQKDLKNRAQYGQNLLELALSDKQISQQAIDNYLNVAKKELENLITPSVIGILFMDNDYSEFPCLAHAPELTVPFYLDSHQKPHGLTIVTKPHAELEALKIGYAIEQYLLTNSSTII